MLILIHCVVNALMRKHKGCSSLAFDWNSKRGLSAHSNKFYFSLQFPCGDWSIVFKLSLRHATILGMPTRGYLRLTG